MILVVLHFFTEIVVMYTDRDICVAALTLAGIHDLGFDDHLVLVGTIFCFE